MSYTPEPAPAICTHTLRMFFYLPFEGSLFSFRPFLPLPFFSRLSFSLPSDIVSVPKQERKNVNPQWKENTNSPMGSVTGALETLNLSERLVSYIHSLSHIIQENREWKTVEGREREREKGRGRKGGSKGRHFPLLSSN